MSKQRKKARPPRRVRLSHYKTPSGALCSAKEGKLTDDGVQVRCGACRAALARGGVQITRVHLRYGAGALCKIENDRKRTSRIDMTPVLDSVTCKNCRRIADEIFASHRASLGTLQSDGSTGTKKRAQIAHDARDVSDDPSAGASAR